MTLTIRNLKNQRKRVKGMPKYFQNERVKYLKSITLTIRILQNDRLVKMIKEGLARTVTKQVNNVKPKSFYKTGVFKVKLAHQYVKHRPVMRLSTRTGG